MAKADEPVEITAFKKVVQIYQYMLFYGNALGAFRVVKNDETAVKVSSKREACTAKVVPTSSDLVCDVEIVIRNLLQPEEKTHFYSYYGAASLCDVYSDPVSTENTEVLAVDKIVRLKLGKAFIKYGLFPLGTYCQEYDVRGQRWNQYKKRIEGRNG